MSQPFQDYLSALDELRTLRDARQATDEVENRFGERFETLWRSLSPLEQEQIDTLSWRAWREKE